jgi:urea transport system permease protein
MGITLALTTVLFIVLLRTRWGVWVRATTQNRVMAGAVGINTRRIDRSAFA